MFDVRNEKDWRLNYRFHDYTINLQYVWPESSQCTKLVLDSCAVIYLPSSLFSPHRGCLHAYLQKAINHVT